MKQPQPFENFSDRELTTVPKTAAQPIPVRNERYNAFEPDFGGEHGRGLLLEYWKILRRRKGIILLFGLLGIVAAILFTLPQTPIYQARTSIEIQGLNDNFLNMKSSDPTTSLPDFSPEAYIQTQIKILQSKTLMQKVIAKLSGDAPSQPPAASPTTSQARTSSWRDVLHLHSRKRPSREEAILGTAQNVAVTSDGTTHIVEISADSTDPKVAADYANALVQEYIDHSLESRFLASQNTGTWLTKQLRELKTNLEKSENELQSYARATGIMYTADRSSVAEEKLRQLQQELGKAQGERVVRQSAYEQATLKPVDSLPDVLNDPTLREYQVKLTDLRRALAEQSATLTAANPKVQRLQAQVEELQRALEKERDSLLKRIRNDYDAADRREKLLEADYRRQAQVVTDQSEKGIHYGILKREVDTNRQIYETMLQRVKESSITAAMKPSNVSVVDPADPPRFPYKPNIFRNAGAGLIGGLVFGIGLVVLRERADRTIQSPGETAYYVNVPELGVIPAAAIDRDNRYGRRRELAAEKQAATKLTPSPDRNGDRNGDRRFTDCVELVTLKRRPSMVAESFRAALASILFSESSVIVFSSSAPSEGKTTIVSNLGVAMAETHRRVLLIDADLRKPRLHHIFDVENERGLSDLLRSERSLDDFPPKDLIRETGVTGLDILPSGPEAVSISDLLYSARLPELLKHVRAKYDVVLIDTPPMLQMPDARILGRMADGVILIVRAGKTTRDTMLVAMQRFVEDGTPVLGTILNNWNPKTRAADGYQGYYNGYQAYYGGRGGREGERRT